MVGTRFSTSRELGELARADLGEFSFVEEPGREQALRLLSYPGRSPARVAKVLADFL